MEYFRIFPDHFFCVQVKNFQSNPAGKISIHRGKMLKRKLFQNNFRKISPRKKFKKKSRLRRQNPNNPPPNTPPNPASPQPLFPQNSKTKPGLSPDRDPPTPCSIENSWKNCMQRGAGSVFTTEAPKNAQYLRQRNTCFRSEPDLQTFLLFISRCYSPIRKEIGPPNTAKYGHLSPT